MTSSAAREPRMEAYHPHHPMRCEDGLMPHEQEGDRWIEYMILQGMTEEGYWLSVSSGQVLAEDYEANGVPVPTDRLTADQKGWAKADHYDHFQKETARWRIIPGKESKVAPAKLAFQIRDRHYRDHCDDEEPKYVLWGYRWDLRPLHQCTLCGEVIIKPPRTYHNNLHDIKEHHDDDNTNALADAGDQVA
jgi:hypothetical protein